mmetsp:Transcript_1482/g.4655  ORF Transcript_1482/g.4655 Transcript_1482/m.4655 type:complete len:451 (-) Transcript_1482:907-2259(-)
MLVLEPVDGRRLLDAQVPHGRGVGRSGDGGRDGASARRVQRARAVRPHDGHLHLRRGLRGAGVQPHDLPERLQRARQLPVDEVPCREQRARLCRRQRRPHHLHLHHQLGRRQDLGLRVRPGLHGLRLLAARVPCGRRPADDGSAERGAVLQVHPRPRHWRQLYAHVQGRDHRRHPRRRERRVRRRRAREPQVPGQRGGDVHVGHDGVQRRRRQSQPCPRRVHQGLRRRGPPAVAGRQRRAPAARPRVRVRRRRHRPADVGDVHEGAGGVLQPRLLRHEEGHLHVLHGLRDEQRRGRERQPRRLRLPQHAHHRVPGRDELQRPRRVQRRPRVPLHVRRGLDGRRLPRADLPLRRVVVRRADGGEQQGARHHGRVREQGHVQPRDGHVQVPRRLRGRGVPAAKLPEGRGRQHLQQPRQVPLHEAARRVRDDQRRRHRLDLRLHAQRPAALGL